MKVPSLCVIGDERPQCVCLRWCTNDKVEQHLIQGTSFFEQRDLGVEKWFVMERSESLQGCVNVLRANQVDEPYTESVPWPFHRFLLNRFYINCYVLYVAITIKPVYFIFNAI